MNDYAAYIPVVNRMDLLRDCVQSVPELYDDLTIVDNSSEQLVPPDPWYMVFTPPVPLSFTQSMNFEFADTVAKGKKFCVHMHSDAIIPEGEITKLLDTAREIDASGRNWGVIYTHYDVLCVYNPVVALDIGGFDTVFRDYFSDNDFYHRMDLAGYERINTENSVGHIGSQTINSDPYLQFRNGVTFPLMRQYYVAKWGGEPGQETFSMPFNNAWNKIMIRRAV